MPRTADYTVTLAREWAPRGLVEEVRIDCLAHVPIAGSAGMQPVAAVVVGFQRARLGRITHDRIEVDHRIEHPRGPYPLIDAGPDLILFLRVIPRPFKRHDGRADHSDAALVCPGHDLRIRRYQLPWLNQR